MPEADDTSTTACPAMAAMQTVLTYDAALAALEEVAPTSRGGFWQQCATVTARLDHAEEAVSWTKAQSLDGAMAQIVLAFAEADRLAQNVEETDVVAQAGIARMTRNFYAALDHLERMAGASAAGRERRMSRRLDPQADLAAAMEAA